MLGTAEVIEKAAWVDYRALNCLPSRRPGRADSAILHSKLRSYPSGKHPKAAAWTLMHGVSNRIEGTNHFQLPRRIEMIGRAKSAVSGLSVRHWFLAFPASRHGGSYLYWLPIMTGEGNPVAGCAQSLEERRRHLQARDGSLYG